MPDYQKKKPVVGVGFSRISASQSLSFETEGRLEETKKKVVKFNVPQKAYMNVYYSQGMRGTGKQYKSYIKRAAVDAGLTVAQVKVQCIIICPSATRVAVLVTPCFFSARLKRRDQVNQKGSSEVDGPSAERGRGAAHALRYGLFRRGRGSVLRPRRDRPARFKP